MTHPAVWRARKISSIFVVFGLTCCGVHNGSNVAEADGLDCPNQSGVIMIVSGTTLDKDRMAAYSRALADSGLYEVTGGVYLNNPRPVSILEGDVGEDDVALIVRFPSRCALQAFWTSETYQNEIRPLRLNPNAGDYTVVVYEALDASFD